MLCVSMKILSDDSAKKETETVKGFKYCNFYWLFLSGIQAVKELTSCQLHAVTTGQAKLDPQKITKVITKLKGPFLGPSDNYLQY